MKRSCAIINLLSLVILPGFVYAQAVADNNVEIGTTTLITPTKSLSREFEIQKSDNLVDTAYALKTQPNDAYAIDTSISYINFVEPLIQDYEAIVMDVSHLVSDVTDQGVVLRFESTSDQTEFLANYDNNSIRDGLLATTLSFKSSNNGISSGKFAQLNDGLTASWCGPITAEGIFADRDARIIVQTVDVSLEPGYTVIGAARLKKCTMNSCSGKCYEYNSPKKYVVKRCAVTSPIFEWFRSKVCVCGAGRTLF